MKYYITSNGDVASDSWLLGAFDDMFDAKEAAFEVMGDDDVLLEYPDGADPLIEDSWGEYADPEQATRTAMLIRADDSIEGVPEGKWFWDDDPETILNSDGSEWDGED